MRTAVVDVAVVRMTDVEVEQADVVVPSLIDVVAAAAVDEDASSLMVVEVVAAASVREADDVVERV